LDRWKRLGIRLAGWSSQGWRHCVDNTYLWPAGQSVSHLISIS